MPRIKTIFSSGICMLCITAITAQALPPKNKTQDNIVGYQLHQQEQWNYNHLPKNSIQFRSDPKYIGFSYKKNPAFSFHSDPAVTTDIQKSSSIASTPPIFSLSTHLQDASYPIPVIHWDGHMGGFIFNQRYSQFEKFQNFKNTSLIKRKTIS
jgi:hypothetical protein